MLIYQIWRHDDPGRRYHVNASSADVVAKWIVTHKFHLSDVRVSPLDTDGVQVGFPDLVTDCRVYAIHKRFKDELRYYLIVREMIHVT